MTIPWQKVFGAAAMEQHNEETLLKASDIVLKMLGYTGVDVDAVAGDNKVEDDKS